MVEAQGSKMKSTMIAPLLWIFGVVIGSVSIYGIAEAQHQTSVHLFVVVLVFTIFMGLVSLANCMLSKGSKDNYEVNNDAEKGKENKAFDTEADAKKNGETQTNGTSTPGDEKWVSNYVPFGDYPKGNIVYVKEYVPQDMITTDMNGVEVINEEPEYNKADYYN